MKNVLVLGGTAEARQLVEDLYTMPAVDPVLSLAGLTTSPAPVRVPVRTRTGRFGGVDGLAIWLVQNKPDAVIDATHPYATTIQANAITACKETGVPHLRLLRPPWPNRPSWFQMPDFETTARYIPPGARVLLTTGTKTLKPFAERTDATFALRTIEPVCDLPENILPLTARPPFTEENERDLMRRLEISHLVTKNAGGSGVAKLNAAETLRLTTLVIARPPVPVAEIAETPDEAVAWLRRTVGFRRNTPAGDQAS